MSLHDHISDRYAVHGELGRGGMATVYRATDRHSGGDVAIKVLRPELAAAMGGERFAREIQVTGTLGHPRILPLLDSGEADGLPFYVTPYIAGGSLEAFLAREGPLPIDDAVRLTADIADALAHAHALGLVHRDIKPANILLTPDGPLLADFGIARFLDASAVDRLTDSGLVIGTLAYMAPEQAAGDRVDARSDVYALGCVLFELLTGAVPYAGVNQRAIMARHAVDPIPSVRTVRDTVSPALESVVARALAKLPADRFASAEAFRDALREARLAAATGAPVDTATRSAGPAPESRGTGASAAIATPARRRGLFAVGAVAAVALLSWFVLARPGATPLEAHRVLVFPLAVSGQLRGSPTAGEDVSTMIGSVMDGAGALRWIDGWQQLDPAQRANISGVSEDDTKRIARRQRCRYVLTGRLVPMGDSVQASVSVLDVEADTFFIAHQGVAPVDQPWRAGLRAATSLLPQLIPGSGTRAIVQEWTDRNPQAIALFLAGEAASRRLAREDALTQFKAAVAADSAFGYAALRGAQAASWAHQYGDAAALARVATQHARSERERLFAIGLQAFLDGRADSAVRTLRRSIALTSDQPAAWMQLSEVYVHLVPTGGPPDSLALEAITSARALDSTNAQLLFHHVELAARARDTATVARLATRFARDASDSLLRAEVELIASCVRTPWTAAQAAQAARRRPQALFNASKLVGLAHPACMRTGYAAILSVDTLTMAGADPRRFFAVIGLQQALLAAGDSAGARRSLADFISRWHVGSSLFLSTSLLVPSQLPESRLVVASDSARLGPDFQRAAFTTRLWLLGVWSASNGAVDRAARVALDLATRAQSPGHGLDSARAASVRGFVALARQDSARAISELRAAMSHAVSGDSVAWEDAAAMGLERLTLARLLLAKRRETEALRVLETFDSAAPAVFPFYAPDALRLRLQIAERMGDARSARTLRERLARFRS